MKRISALLLMLAFVAPLQMVDAQVQTYKFYQEYTHQGTESKCSFYVPSSYDPEKSYPMFFAWHGAGESSSSMNEFMVSTIAKYIDAIVVAPDANKIETDEQLQYLIDTTLNFIFSTYNIDKSRSIVTGYSWGGRIAYEIGLRHPDLFAGVIGIAPAVIENDFDQEMWNNINKNRMATIIGDQDFNYSLVDNLMNQIIVRGGNVLYKVKQNINHWDYYYEEIQFKQDYRECYDYVIAHTTAVDPVEAPENMEVEHYPSPADGIVHFTLPETRGNVYDIVVRDITGRICYQGTTETSGTAQHWSFNSAALPSGVYFAEIASKGVRTVESFIVSHR